MLNWSTGEIDATEDVEWCSSGPWCRAARDHFIFLRRDSSKREAEGNRERKREVKNKGEVESEEREKELSPEGKR